jgi:DNA-directed RNA polymerase specialized sigma24 family protein
MRSITNACINAQTRARPMLSLAGSGDDEAGVPELADRAVARPDDIAIGHELEHAIALGLAGLPVSQRAALEMKSLGCDNDEIAAALGISANNAAVQIYRARRALAEHLAPFLTREAIG